MRRDARVSAVCVENVTREQTFNGPAVSCGEVVETLSTP